MTIKKKIRLSNIMMVLIPILVTTVVLIVYLNTSLGSYWHTFVSMYSDENGVQFAQSMIYNYQQELWENNWGNCPEMDDCQTGIRHSDEMTHLENKLSGLGYRFMITKDGESIYSNLSETDFDTARSVAGDAIDYAKMLTASRYEVSVIKSTCPSPGNRWNHGELPEKRYSALPGRNFASFCGTDRVYQRHPLLVDLRQYFKAPWKIEPWHKGDSGGESGYAHAV